jgi:hypothetical protein
MKNIKRFVLSLSALLLISGVALAAPVSARHASAEDSTVSSDSSSSDDSASSPDDSGHQIAEQLKLEAKSKLEAAQAKHQERTQEQRQKACTARKANLTKRMANAVSQADRHKGVMDDFYTKVKDFYTNKNLNVTNYADLTAAVDKAQTDAQTSIDALSALDVNVDCSSQTVAASVSAFQTAVSDTRDSLKVYRKSLVDLITALKGASTGTDKSSDSGSTDNTNTSNQ